MELRYLDANTCIEEGGGAGWDAEIVRLNKVESCVCIEFLEKFCVFFCRSVAEGEWFWFGVSGVQCTAQFTIEEEKY